MCAGERERRVEDRGRRANEAPSPEDPKRSRPRRTINRSGRPRQALFLHTSMHIVHELVFAILLMQAHRSVHGLVSCASSLHLTPNGKTAHSRRCLGPITSNTIGLKLNNDRKLNEVWWLRLDEGSQQVGQLTHPEAAVLGLSRLHTSGECESKSRSVLVGLLLFQGINLNNIK